MDQRTKIFTAFTTERRLRFSALERATGLRSNELAYYLKSLLSEGVLVKDGDEYVLSFSAEQDIPFFHEAGSRVPLPVVLVGCWRDDKVLLVRREKRPYKDLWSLPGGRLLLGESVSDAAVRLMREKTFLDVSVDRVAGVGNERVEDGGVIKHGFVLLYVLASPLTDVVEKERVRWFAPSDLDADKTIPSDYAYVTGRAGAFEEFRFSVD